MSVVHVFDWMQFREDVRTAVRFLDNVIDKTHYHLPETREAQMRLRRIGLGVMGLADALIMQDMVYGEQDAIEFTEAVFKAMKEEAIVASNELAVERGAAGAWDDSMWNRPYLKGFERLSEVTPEAGMRNLFLLTQAPTGTTSIVAGVNSGIEPYFAFRYTRVDRTGEHEVVARIAQEFQWSKALVTANEVGVEAHIQMQAAAQKYIDSSVSKTINAPNEHTVEDVMFAFRLAYEMDLKGLAYFRDGCGRAQVLYREKPEDTVKKLEAIIAMLEEKLKSSFKQKVGGPPVANFFAQGAPLLAITPTGDKCPSCNEADIVYQEGCMKCPECGWSAC
jgi:ribonucleoside-diphosphate reductase alpha chain